MPSSDYFNCFTNAYEMYTMPNTAPTYSPNASLATTKQSRGISAKMTTNSHQDTAKLTSCIVTFKINDMSAC